MQSSEENPFNDPSHAYYCLDRPYPVDDAMAQTLLDPQQDIEGPVVKYILTYLAHCGGLLPGGKRCGVVDPHFTHEIFREVIATEPALELPTRPRHYPTSILSGYRSDVDSLVIPLYAHAHWTLFLFDSSSSELLFYNSLQPDEDWPLPRALYLSTAEHVLAELRLRGFEIRVAVTRTAPYGTYAKQSDNHSCGIHVCLIAERFLTGTQIMALSSISVDRERRRFHGLLQEIRSGHIPSYRPPEMGVLQYPEHTQASSLAEPSGLMSAGQVEGSAKRKLASSVWSIGFERHGAGWKCKHCEYTMPQKRAANAKRHLRLVHQLTEPQESDKRQKERKPTEIEQLLVAIASREKEKAALEKKISNVGGQYVIAPFQPPIQTHVGRITEQESDEPVEERRIRNREYQRALRVRVAVAKSRLRWLGDTIDQLRAQWTKLMHTSIPQNAANHVGPSIASAPTVFGSSASNFPQPPRGNSLPVSAQPTLHSSLPSSLVVDGSFGTALPRMDFSHLIDDRSTHRLTLRDWLHSIVQALDAENAVLRPLEAPRGYSIATFIVRYYDVFQSVNQRMTGMRDDMILRPFLDWKQDYTGMTTFYVDEEEAKFAAVIHQHVPIWIIAQEVREAAFHDHSGILLRFYRILLVLIGTLFAKLVSRVNWMCFETLRGNANRPMLNYPHLANLLLEDVGSETHDNSQLKESLDASIGCKEETLLEALSACAAPVLDANFYAKCARAFPRLRDFILRRKHRLPRPSIEEAKLTNSGLSIWKNHCWEDVSASKYAFRTLLVDLSVILCPSEEAERTAVAHTCSLILAAARTDRAEIRGLLETAEGTRLELLFASHCLRNAAYVREVSVDLRTTEQLKVCLQFVDDLHPTTRCLEIRMNNSHKKRPYDIDGREFARILSHCGRAIGCLRRLNEVRITASGVYNAEHVFMSAFAWFKSLMLPERIRFTLKASTSNVQDMDAFAALEGLERVREADLWTEDHYYSRRSDGFCFYVRCYAEEWIHITITKCPSVPLDVLLDMQRRNDDIRGAMAAYYGQFFRKFMRIREGFLNELTCTYAVSQLHYQWPLSTACQNRTLSNVVQAYILLIGNTGFFGVILEKMRKVEHFRNFLSLMNFLNAYLPEPDSATARSGTLDRSRPQNLAQRTAVCTTNMTVCEFNPPPPSWATRRRMQMDEESTFGTDAYDRPTPPFVPCSRFSLHDTAPEDTVLLTPDGHRGYRTLAYLLFFEESLYMKLRSVLSQYVIDHADASWVRRLFGDSYSVRRNAYARLRAKLGVVPPAEWMTSIDLVAASYVFDLNIMCLDANQWTIYNRLIIQNETLAGQQIKELPTILIRYTEGHFLPVFSLRRKDDPAKPFAGEDPTRSAMLFKFQPPTLGWIFAMRRSAGIVAIADNKIKLPENVCPHAFYGANAAPFKYGKIDESDANSGYRALAYCLFFEEDMYTLMRQLLSSYLVLHAGERWVQRYFGEADEVRKSAVARMVTSASSTSQDLATIDFVAAATIFHVNILVHAESSWTVYNSDIVEKERIKVEQIDGIPTVMIERCFGWFCPINTALERSKMEELSFERLPFTDYAKQWKEEMRSRVDSCHDSPSLLQQEGFEDDDEADAENVGLTSFEKLCSFKPPSIADAVRMRRALGIPVDADSRMVVPSFVPSPLFGTHTAVPNTTVPVPADEDSGYRTLAYLLLFDGELHWLVRQVLGSYVILHAAEHWVKRLFGEAEAVRNSALTRVRANAEGKGDDRCLSTIDLNAAATLFDVNIICYDGTRWTICNRHSRSSTDESGTVEAEQISELPSILISHVGNHYAPVTSLR